MSGVAIGAGLSAEGDPAAGVAAAVEACRRGLRGRRPDLVVLFAAGEHLRTPQALLEAVHVGLRPADLIGCGAGGVLGDGREIESGTAVAVWAGAFAPDAGVTAFHAEVQTDGETAALSGFPALSGARAGILLADPYTFPTESLLEHLCRAAPAVPILGGLASAASQAGGAVLFCGHDVHGAGAVGARLDGIEVLPCVSQGAAPLGPEVTITAAEGNVIHELAGAPALETLERLLGALEPGERRLVGRGLMLGIVVDAGKPDYGQGDFLVRPLAGVDREAGYVAVGAEVRAGQVVRLHARDARSADAELRRELALRARALAGDPVAGALVFSCNGRGRDMFGTDDHDALAVAKELGGAPSAGFFAAGEIGPVGGRSFLHGFTATVGVFPS